MVYVLLNLELGESARIWEPASGNELVTCERRQRLTREDGRRSSHPHALGRAYGVLTEDDGDSVRDLAGINPPRHGTSTE